jgi:hypothetical protein
VRRPRPRAISNALRPIAHNDNARLDCDRIAAVRDRASPALIDRFRGASIRFVAGAAHCPGPPRLGAATSSAPVNGRLAFSNLATAAA